MKFIKKRIIWSSILAIFIAGYLIPENQIIPVAGASRVDWDSESFWHENWGRSGVHKGIDIFAPKGTPLYSSCYGIVLFNGELELGGNVVLLLGPKWRLHYYAHLEKSSVHFMSVLATGDPIGSVGDTGNAQGKPAHLHYSIITLFPYVWRIDGSSQGWKKMFFLDPGEKLLQ